MGKSKIPNPIFIIQPGDTLMKPLRYLVPILASITLSMAVSASASEEQAKKNNCLMCHTVDKKVIGPAFKEISEKYKGDTSAAEMLAGKVKNGGGGVWGQIPMPPNAAVPDEEIKELVDWILTL